ncbi:hypothetical protein GGU11DRAFT_547116 [Lentinula aff. detonsa]|nr:hypothetical protein GGU11DRAFT_547116 [Lentinula aff. detonsa]
MSRSKKVESGPFVFHAALPHAHHDSQTQALGETIIWIDWHNGLLSKDSKHPRDMFTVQSEFVPLSTFRRRAPACCVRYDAPSLEFYVCQSELFHSRDALYRDTFPGICARPPDRRTRLIFTAHQRMRILYSGYIFLPLWALTLMKWGHLDIWNNGEP